MFFLCFMAGRKICITATSVTKQDWKEMDVI